MTKDKMIYLNGAPGTGKSTLARHILAAEGGKDGRVVLCNPLDFLYGESYATISHDHYTTIDSFIADCRDVVRKEAIQEFDMNVVGSKNTVRMHMSLRTLLVYTSQNILKPQFGDDYLCQKVVDYVGTSSLSAWCCGERKPRIYVIEVGFQNEVDAMVKAFKGCDQMLFVIEAEGKKYTDSRGYVHLEGNTEVWANKMTKDYTEVDDILNKFINT